MVSRGLEEQQEGTVAERTERKGQLLQKGQKEEAVAEEAKRKG